MSQAYLGKSSNPPPTEYWPSRETWQVDTSKGQNKRGDDRWKMSTLEAEKKVNDAKTFTTVLSLSHNFLDTRLLVLVKKPWTALRHDHGINREDTGSKSKQYECHKVMCLLTVSSFGEPHHPQLDPLSFQPP
jgi:hypothetical protein